MKYFIISLFIVLSSFCHVETKVYICGPTGAKKYHYKEHCRGLTACRHVLTLVPLSQAQGYGLTLCGWED
jgi:hypothetical protein